MDLKYVARQLLQRPGHTLAVIACLVIGLVASVGTFSVITSVLYGDRPGALVSGDFFRALRTTPLRGRLLSPEDDRPAAAPVAVVTEYFWRTHLDGRDDAIGQPVLLGGTSFTVIGLGLMVLAGLSASEATICLPLPSEPPG